MRVIEAIAPSTDGVTLGQARDEIEHVCRYIRQGECYAWSYLFCPVQCPSEWCPFCTGDACRQCHWTEHCEHDVVDRHEDRVRQ